MLCPAPPQDLPLDQTAIDYVTAAARADDPDIKTEKCRQALGALGLRDSMVFTKIGERTAWQGARHGVPGHCSPPYMHSCWTAHEHSVLRESRMLRQGRGAPTSPTPSRTHRAPLPPTPPPPPLPHLTPHRPAVWRREGARGTCRVRPCARQPAAAGRGLKPPRRGHHPGPHRWVGYCGGWVQSSNETPALCARCRAGRCVPGAVPAGDGLDGLKAPTTTLNNISHSHINAVSAPPPVTLVRGAWFDAAPTPPNDLS